MKNLILILIAISFNMHNSFAQQRLTATATFNRNSCPQPAPMMVCSNHYHYVKCDSSTNYQWSCVNPCTNTISSTPTAYSIKNSPNLSYSEIKTFLATNNVAKETNNNDSIVDKSITGADGKRLRMNIASPYKVMLSSNLVNRAIISPLPSGTPTIISAITDATSTVNSQLASSNMKTGSLPYNFPEPISLAASYSKSLLKTWLLSLSNENIIKAARSGRTGTCVLTTSNTSSSVSPCQQFITTIDNPSGANVECIPGAAKVAGGIYGCASGESLEVCRQSGDALAAYKIKEKIVKGLCNLDQVANKLNAAPQIIASDSIASDSSIVFKQDSATGNISCFKTLNSNEIQAFDGISAVMIGGVKSIILTDEICQATYSRSFKGAMAEGVSIDNMPDPIPLSELTDEDKLAIRTAPAVIKYTPDNYLSSYPKISVSTSRVVQKLDMPLSTVLASSVTSGIIEVLPNQAATTTTYLGSEYQLGCSNTSSNNNQINSSI